MPTFSPTTPPAVDRVQAAIALLQCRGTAVSLKNLVAADRELRPGQRPLAETTILHNPGAYALYQAARAWQPRAIKRRRGGNPKGMRTSQAELEQRLATAHAEIAFLEAELTAVWRMVGDEQRGTAPPRPDRTAVAEEEVERHLQLIQIARRLYP